MAAATPRRSRSAGRRGRWARAAGIAVTELARRTDYRLGHACLSNKARTVSLALVGVTLASGGGDAGAQVVCGQVAGVVERGVGQVGQPAVLAGGAHVREVVQRLVGVGQAGVAVADPEL